MTMLNDRRIGHLLMTGRIVRSYPMWMNQIYSAKPMHVGPASLDLHLGRKIIRQLPGIDAITPRRKESMEGCWGDERELEIGEEFTLMPGEFVLAETAEVMEMPDNIGGLVSARSTYGRVGLQVCGDAGFIDPGFEGTITLELHNTGVRPLLLIPGERVLQLVMWRTDGASERPYGSEGLGSQYQGQRGPTVPGGSR